VLSFASEAREYWAVERREFITLPRTIPPTLLARADEVIA